MLNDLPENGLASSDGAFAFVLDLPEGLEATDSTAYKLTGVDGFDLSATQEKGGKRLVVKARLIGSTIVGEAAHRCLAPHLRRIHTST